MTSEPPYAVTMWDFSYITRRQGAEAEYADWDKVLDELAELYDSDQSTEEGRRNRKLAVLLCADVGWAPPDKETSVK